MNAIETSFNTVSHELGYGSTFFSERHAKILESLYNLNTNIFNYAIAGTVLDLGCGSDYPKGRKADETAWLFPPFFLALVAEVKNNLGYDTKNIFGIDSLPLSTHDFTSQYADLYNHIQLDLVEYLASGEGTQTLIETLKKASLANLTFLNSTMFLSQAYLQIPERYYRSSPSVLKAMNLRTNLAGRWTYHLKTSAHAKQVKENIGIRLANTYLLANSLLIEGGIFHLNGIFMKKVGDNLIYIADTNTEDLKMAKDDKFYVGIG